MKTRKYVLFLVLLAANQLWAVDFTPSAGTPTPMTKWTSADGRIIISRELRLEGENVVLERSDGKVFSVPVTRLSPESRAMAKMDAPAPTESKNGRGQMQQAQPPASVNKKNSQPTPTVAQAQAPNIQQPQSFMTAWWNEWSTLARIVLVSLLVMFASSFKGLIARLVVAALVVALFPVDSWFPSGSSKLTQFAACFAAVSILPSIFKIGSSIRLLLALAVLFGLPTLLVSHHLFGSPWRLATVDATVGVVLLSVGIIRVLVRVKRRDEEDKKTAQEAYFTELHRVSSLIPSFLDAAPMANDLAKMLGIREADGMKRMLLLESRLIRDPARTGLTPMRRMLTESQTFATRAEEISDALHERVNGAHNTLSNRAKGERDPYATERQHHYKRLQKDLDWLEPSLTQFQSERKRFQNDLRGYLTRAIVNLANGGAWGGEYEQEWQNLLRDAPFEDYTLEKLARDHYGQ